jgi:C1A family cysteine protease
MKRVYNLLPQAPDERDYKLKVARLEKRPDRVDLRANEPPIWDQGNLGACTAFAGTAALMEYHGTKTDLSQLYLYYKTRELAGNIGVDSGATMRDLMRAMKKTGTCEESLWPYRISKYATKPPAAADTNAAKYRIGSYWTFDDDGIDDVTQIKNYLAQYGRGVLIGMRVYSNFEKVGSNGILTLPNLVRDSFLGGHAIKIVGYDEHFRDKPCFLRSLLNSFLGIVDTGETDYFIVRNSYGPEWGHNGYFYMPCAYVRKGYAFDAWVTL